MAKKLMNIAVLITAIDTNAQVSMLQGFERFAQQHDCNVAVFAWFTGSYEREKHNLGEVNIINLPDLNLFDGVVVVANTVHMETNRRIISEKLKDVYRPIVCIGARLGDYYYVGSDTYSAMRGLVEHFVMEHRMRRLFFVKGIAGNPDAEERFRAYLDVLSENDIPVDEELIFQGDFDIVGGERAALQIVKSGRPLPEAIICANDVTAITVCGILQKHGYSIPGDVAVTGYDGSEEGRLCNPMLTTVQNSADRQAEEACSLLWKLAHGESVDKDLLIADEIVYGESCGCKNAEVLKRYSEQRRDIGKEAFERSAIRHMQQQEKDIMEGDTYEEWLVALKAFISKIQPDEFYCCTNANFMETVFGYSIIEQESMSAKERQAYTEMSKVMVAYRNGEFVKKADFRSCYGLDNLFEEADSGKMYIFSPVHYLDRNFGYMVFVNSFFTVGNTLYVNWLINMGHTIENIRKQKLLQNAMRELDEMYVRDSLTGVYNRFGMERFSREIKKRCIREQKPLFLGFIDMDGLKRINDRYGHENGDHIIRKTAEILSHVRKDFYVARYGGDEYVVMGMVADEDEVDNYWTMVEQSIDDYNMKNPYGGRLSISYGYHMDEVSADTDMANFIRTADSQMYFIKNRKKKGQRPEE